jgi:hypothetical protein
MAVHAGLGGGNASIAGFLNRSVAVLALKAQSRHVMFVAEGNRLLRSLALASNPWGALQLIERYSKCNHNQTSQHQARSSQSIGAAVKYLRHECFPACCSLSSNLCTQCWRSHRLWLDFFFGQNPPERRTTPKIQYSSQRSICNGLNSWENKKCLYSLTFCNLLKHKYVPTKENAQKSAQCRVSDCLREWDVLQLDLH